MNEKLNPYHIGILIYMNQVGVGAFVLPRICAEYFGTNGWLALFILSGVAILNIYLISLVHRLGKGRSIFAIIDSFLPKLMRYPLYFALAAVWAAIANIVAKQYAIILQMVSFPATNPMIFKITIDVMTFILVTKGIYTISKASTLFFHLTTWMVFLLGFNLKEFELDRLTLFIFRGDTNFVSGGLEIFSVFLGYEICMLLFPYVQSNTKWFKAVYSGNLLLTFIYVVTSIVAFGFFSLEQLKVTLLPMLDLIAFIKSPIIERIESLLFTFFLFTVLITTVLYFWMAIEALKQVLPKAKTNWIAFVIIIATLFISYIPDVLVEATEWLYRLSLIEMCIAFIVPIMLITVLLIQSKRGIAHD